MAACTGPPRPHTSRAVVATRANHAASSASRSYAASKKAGSCSGRKCPLRLLTVVPPHDFPHYRQIGVCALPGNGRGLRLTVGKLTRRSRD